MSEVHDMAEAILLRANQNLPYRTRVVQQFDVDAPRLRALVESIAEEILQMEARLEKRLQVVLLGETS